MVVESFYLELSAIVLWSYTLTKYPPQNLKLYFIFDVPFLNLTAQKLLQR